MLFLGFLLNRTMTLVRLRSRTIVEKQAEACRSRKSFTGSTMKAGRCPANPISRLEQDGGEQETPLSRTCSDKSCTVGSDPEGHKCPLEELVELEWAKLASSPIQVYSSCREPRVLMDLVGWQFGILLHELDDYLIDLSTPSLRSSLCCVLVLLLRISNALVSQVH